MTKALTITNILTVLAAIVIICVSVLFGSKADKQIAEFLGKADAIELFKNSNSQKTVTNEKATSPLVKQAQAFAQYLNPPSKAQSREPRKTFHTPSIPRPKTVSAKFNLIGTSYFKARPELSLALFDEPGKGLTWVRQSSSIGHLVIEDIRDGSVIAKDGDRSIELVALRQRHKSLVKNKDSVSAIDSAIVSPKSALPLTASVTAPETMVYIDEKENKLFGEHLKQMGALNINAEANRKKGEEILEQLMKQLNALKVSEEEAKKLDNLGKELDDANNSVKKTSEKVEEKKAILKKRAADRRTRRSSRKVQ